MSTMSTMYCFKSQKTLKYDISRGTKWFFGVIKGHMRDTYHNLYLRKFPYNPSNLSNTVICLGFPYFVLCPTDSTSSMMSQTSEYWPVEGMEQWAGFWIALVSLGNKVQGPECCITDSNAQISESACKKWLTPRELLTVKNCPTLPWLIWLRLIMWTLKVWLIAKNDIAVPCSKELCSCLKQWKFNHENV